jgi:hypothetical protein
MGTILIGTASWTDPTLIASGWYPDGAKSPEARLKHYAEHFPVVEVDSAYYALPSLRNAELWVARTPERFVFDIKANPEGEIRVPCYESLSHCPWTKFGASAKAIWMACRTSRSSI